MQNFGLAYPWHGSSLLYANHFPPLPGFLPRVFGPLKLTPEMIKRLAALNTSLRPVQPQAPLAPTSKAHTTEGPATEAPTEAPTEALTEAPTPETPAAECGDGEVEVIVESKAQREIQELKARVKLLEQEVDVQERLFRFTTRVTKKLILLDQLGDKERKIAIELGIPAGDDCPWIGKILTANASTSMDALNRPGAMPAPTTRTVGVTAESVTVLHHCSGFDTVESESCVVGMMGHPIPTLDDSVTDVIAYGSEPRVSDIAVHLDDSSSRKALEGYAERIGRLTLVVEASTCMLKVALAKAKEVRRLSEAAIGPATSEAQSTAVEVGQPGH